MIINKFAKLSAAIAVTLSSLSGIVTVRSGILVLATSKPSGILLVILGFAMIGLGIRLIFEYKRIKKL